MIRKGNEVKWTYDVQEYFDQIKKALTEAPVLIIPNYSKEFLIFFFSSSDTLATEKYKWVRAAYFLFHHSIKGCINEI
jgi:hypothetical protein